MVVPLAVQVALPLLLLASVQLRPMLASDTLSVPAAETARENNGSIVTIIAKDKKIAPMRFTLFIVMLLSV